MDARDILIKPLVTEKTTALMEERKYTFRVPLAATKVEILQLEGFGEEQHEGWL